MASPTTYTWHFSKEAVGALQRLIGELATTVYAPLLEVSVNTPHYYLSTSFSIPKQGRSYLNLYSGTWHETDIFWTNYFEFTISETNAPYNLETQYDISSRRMRIPFGSINFHSPCTPIRTIQIFEEQQTEQDDEHWEVVMSDSLLLFTRESNEQFLIYIDNVSIAGSVLLVADKATVQDVLSGKNYNLVQELR